MSSFRSLIDKLEFPPEAISRNLPGDDEELIDSIRNHLQLMLNTRHGNSQTVPDYGVSCFSDLLRSKESMQQIQQEIKRSIEKHEPRLTNVTVRFSPLEKNPFRMNFDITATVVTDEQDVPTVFRTVIEGSGQVKVDRS